MSSSSHVDSPSVSGSHHDVDVTTTSLFKAIAAQFPEHKLPRGFTRRFDTTSYTQFLEHVARRNRFQLSANMATRVITDSEYDALLSTSPVDTSTPASLFSMGSPALRGYHFAVHATSPDTLLYQSHKQFLVPRLDDIHTIILSFLRLFPNLDDAYRLHEKVSDMYAFIPLEAVAEFFRRERSPGPPSPQVLPSISMPNIISPFRFRNITRASAPSPSPSRARLSAAGIATPPSASPVQRRKSHGIDPALLTRRKPFDTVANHHSRGSGRLSHEANKRKSQAEGPGGGGGRENSSSANFAAVKKPRHSYIASVMQQVSGAERKAEGKRHSRSVPRQRVNTSNLMEAVADKPDAMDEEDEEAVEMLMMFAQGRRMF